MKNICLFFVVAASFVAQQVPKLDLTVPIDRSSLPVVGGIGSSSSLAFSVSLVEIPQQASIGDAFTYEVEIKNEGSSAVTIPWSADRLWESDILPEQIFRATVSLS